MLAYRNLNTKTIRQSVIANLVKQGHDLRLVQTFTGHKYPSATERYRQTGIEELKAGIEKYHPLKRRSCSQPAPTASSGNTIENKLIHKEIEQNEGNERRIKYLCTNSGTQNKKYNNENSDKS